MYKTTGRSPVEAQGGQLEIAGVVVGQWGPNMSNRRSRGSQLPPQVMSVGHRGRYSSFSVYYLSIMHILNYSTVICSFQPLMLLAMPLV